MMWRLARNRVRQGADPDMRRLGWCERKRRTSLVGMTKIRTSEQGKPGDPEVLFRDARFVVLNKPAGLAVHAGPRGGPSVEEMFPALSRRRDGPWLAHRLDADTAGCLVVALTKTGLIAAQAEFAGGRAEKIYWAV